MWFEIIVTILVGAASVGWNAASTGDLCSQGTIMTGQGLAGAIALVTVGSLLVIAHNLRRSARWQQALVVAATVGVSALFLSALGIAIWAIAEGCTR
jgi:hypothetical protein